MQIENTIFNNSLPVNSIAIIDRLKELLNENQTNNINEAIKNDKSLRIEKCIWLLLSTYVSQIGSIDMAHMWEHLYTYSKEL